MHLTSWLIDDFTFNIKTSLELLAQTSRNEWVVKYGCIHHMDKNGFLLSSFDNVVEK